ncbi:MAG: OmpA family protein [Campylobacterota bacterium]|nr:OmpA family protein [Campylobacterota bacterium]
MMHKNLYAGLIALLLFILLLSFALAQYSQKIPTELESRVQNLLKEHAIDWVEVRSEGRDITLSGLAPTLEEHHRAVELCQSIYGIRTLEDKISPIPIAPYSMSIEYNDKVITLKGYMPSLKSKEALFAKLKTIHSSKVIDKVDIGAGEPVMWSELIDILISNTHKLDFASFNLIDNKLYMSGRIATQKELKSFNHALTTLKDSPFTIYNNIMPLDRPAKICQAKFDTLLSKEKIEFESGTSIIKNNESFLQELSKISLLCSNANIEIIGYTDSVGDEQKNLELSLNRAKVVVAKLFGLGIELTRMKAVGKGSVNPIANNNTPEGRAKNRRIEFKVLRD